jgi:hypothetical protein
MALLDFDLANLLFPYFVLVIIALVIRLFLVVKPIWKLIMLASNKSIRKSLNKFRKLSSLKLGLQRFILIEIGLLLIPLSMFMIFRWKVGNPELIEWNNSQIIISLVIGGLWLTIEVLRSLKVRKSLKPLGKWYASPSRVSKGLDVVVWSRSKLEVISNWEMPETETEEQQLVDDDESTVTTFRESLTTKAREVILSVKEKTIEVSKKIAESVDEKVQQNVDNTLRGETRNLQRIYTFVTDLFMGLMPLIVIYYVLPGM